MNNTFLKNFKKQLNRFYIFLGKDIFISNKNQDRLISFAYEKNFTEKITITVENIEDFEKIFHLYHLQNLFFKKIVIIVNFMIKKLNCTFIEKIKKLSFFIRSDIVTILKFHHLLYDVEKNHLLKIFKNDADVVSCYTPYNLHFLKWIKYEIKEKNIKIENDAFFLLCKYYEGNTFFIYTVLDILSATWPHTMITLNNIKNIISDVFEFSPIHWINAMFQGYIKKSIYILNRLNQKNYDPLILIRMLQKDLLMVVHIQRKKKDISIYLKKHHVWSSRHKFFINAVKKICYKNLLESIKILLNIEIQIKKKYNYFIWNQLQELTFILCTKK